jgi:hypothetical protein
MGDLGDIFGDFFGGGMGGLYIFCYWILTGLGDYLLLNMILLFGAPFFIAKITSLLIHNTFQTKSPVQKNIAKSSTAVIVIVLGVFLVFLSYFSYLVLSLFIQ